MMSETRSATLLKELLSLEGVSADLLPRADGCMQLTIQLSIPDTDKRIQGVLFRGQ